MAHPQETVEQLAAKFVELVKEDLTPAEFAEVQRANGEALARGDQHGCATQDVRDANMIMDAAFHALGIDPFNAEGEVDQATCDLWNAAWDIAYRGALQPQPEA